MVSFSSRISRLGKSRKDVGGRRFRGLGKRLETRKKRQFEETSQSAAFGVPGLALKPGVKADGKAVDFLTHGSRILVKLAPLFLE